MTFDELTNLALQNQFLVGGIGTVAAGGAAYLARSIPSRILAMAKRTFSTNFTITTRYREFDDIAILINRYAIPFMMRNFAPAKGETPVIRSYRQGKKRAPSNLSPGYGGGWGMYKKTLFFYTRSMMETQASEGLQEQISIQFFTRDVSILSEFMHEATTLNDEGLIKILLSEDTYFSPGPSRPKREMSTIFANKDTLVTLVGKIQGFLDNEEWYKKRGIPYKLVIIMYGVPGTGKTSIVHALASHFNLNVNYVTSLFKIDALVGETSASDLMVIEDIDGLSDHLNRETVSTSRPVDNKGNQVKDVALHRLLNSLDGFCTPNGLKVIITTNHIDKLDPALLRAGRTDLLIEIKPLDGQAIREMYATYYGEEKADALNLSRTPPMTGSALQGMFKDATAEQAAERLEAASAMSIAAE